MRADQTDCGSVMLVGGNDRSAKKMLSDSKFFRRDTCMAFLDLHELEAHEDIFLLCKEKFILCCIQIEF